MTLKGGTTQACASCKYQRRKCTPECALAPYFPPDQPKVFQNAHRLFGVSNILKILKQLDPSQKMVAMQSIIYQANIRDKFPVHGCLGIICQLRYQILQAEEELHVLNSQLALYRQHENDNNALTLFHQNPIQHYNSMSAFPISSHHHHNVGNNFADYIDSKDTNLINSFCVQQSYTMNDNNNNNTIPMQSQFIAPQPITIQEEATQEYDEMHPFFDTIDDRQSYIDSKDGYESSSESSFKDTTQSLELTLLRCN